MQEEHDIEQLHRDRIELRAVFEELTAKVHQTSQELARVHADNRRARVALSAVRIQMGRDGAYEGASAASGSHGGDNDAALLATTAKGTPGHASSHASSKTTRDDPNDDRRRGGTAPAMAMSDGRGASVGASRGSANRDSARSGGGGGAKHGAQHVHHQRQSSTNKLEWTRGQMLGEGAFSVVFLGLNKATGQLLAVKQLKKEGLGRLTDESHGDGGKSGDDAMCELEEEIRVRWRWRGVG